MSIYVNFGDDLPGSCTQADHADWMEVSSFTHGLNRPYAAAGAWDPADFHDFVFTKSADKATPLINKHILAGTCFDEVVVHFATTVGEEAEVPVYKLTLSKVRITSYSIDGQSKGVSPEVLSINAEEVGWDYEVQDGESPGGVIDYKYSVKERKPL